VFRKVEEAIKNDPDTFKQVQKHANLRAEFVQGVSSLIGVAGVDFNEVRQYLNAILSSQDGQVPMVQKLLFDISYCDHYGLLQDLGRATSKDIAEICRTPGLKHDFLDKMGTDERALIQNVLSTGKIEPEDRLRAFVVFRNLDYREGHIGDETIRQAIAVLDSQCKTEEGKENLQKKYFEKYGSILYYDLRATMRGKDFEQASKDLATVGKRSDEDFEQVQHTFASRRRGVGPILIDKFVDGTGFQPRRNEANNGRICRKLLKRRTCIISMRH
jgi:hypothetical protein